MQSDLNMPTTKRGGFNDYKKNLELLLIIPGLKESIKYLPSRFVFSGFYSPTFLVALFEYFFEVLFQGLATKVFRNNNPFRVN